MALTRAPTRQAEFPLIRVALARKCAALAAGTPDQMAEWFAVMPSEQTVLLPLATLRLRGKRALAQQARAAPAVFAQAVSRERLASVVARPEQALGASASVGAAQVASPDPETSS